MAKKRLTKKSGPSRRPPKKSRLKVPPCEYRIHEMLRQTFLKITDYKGESSQARFQRIFTGDFVKPPWFVGVRRATEHEDFHEGTDYFIITSNYGEIRFDVKSSFRHFEEQKKEQEGKPIFVWCVVVKTHFTDEEIRRAVFKKCEIHIARLRRQVRLGCLSLCTA